MARKQNKLEWFQAELNALHESIPETLRLASLGENRLEGFAALFTIVLPLLNASGEPVFTPVIVSELVRALNSRFGGCLIPSSSSHPPYWGLWQPAEGPATEPVKDYVTIVQVFANPIEPTNHFFVRLKQVLKVAGKIEQQEILISRIDCRLI